MGAGDAVDDHRIRRDARGRREAPVPLRRGNAAVLADEILGEPVELAGGDAGLRELAQQRDRAGDDGSCALHPCDLSS